MFSNPMCEWCKKAKAAVIHHLDNSKTNHVEDNLVPLCRACHLSYHAKNGDVVPPSIFYKGKPLKEWAAKLGVGYTVVWRRHKDTGQVEKSNPTSIGIRAYGQTFTAMGKELGVSKQRVHQLHHENKLEKRLASKRDIRYT